MSPRVLSLPQAVHEIVNVTKPSLWQKTNAPITGSRFFFIVGAGISYPSIPLAAGIEELCRKEIEHRGRTPSALNQSPIERYEAHFQEAFPQPEDRRAFLHHHIKSAAISAANFRLAHLISTRQLTNLVVTTNFDELLTKALRLFGEDVLVCDHPKTTQRIDPKRDDFQIVHVHGTHWFYDCCNLKDEIEGRAQTDLEGNTSMGHLLDRMLFDRSPLVVGYSGWEGDVVMAALKRRLKTPLSTNLYWFCFRRAEMETLPAWLKEHGNVRIVLPPEVTPPRKAEDIGIKPSSAGATMQVVQLPANTDSRPQESVLPARQVFDALIHGLKLQEPRLTKDPLDFFADHLRKNLVAPDVPEVPDADDIYLIRQVIRHVEDGARLTRLEIEKRSQKEKETIELLEQMSKAVRSAAYAEAIEIAQKIDIQLLTEAQRTDLDATLENIHINASDLATSKKLEASQIRVLLCEIAKKSGDKDLDWPLREAKALHSKGYLLALSGRQDDAIATYDDLIHRFNDSPSITLKDRIAKALANKGTSLTIIGKNDEAIATYDEIIRRFGNSIEPIFSESIAVALGNKGLLLALAGKHSEAMDSYDEVIRRFEHSTDSTQKLWTAKILFIKGVTLAMANRQSEAIATYDEVIQRFSGSAESALKEPIAMALNNKGIALGILGEQVKAIAAHDEVIQRFGDATESEMLRQIAIALGNKASALGSLGRYAEAGASYDELVQRFGGSTSPSQREWAVAALNNKGFALSAINKYSESVAAYDELLQRFGGDTEPGILKHVAIALNNKGSTLGTLDKHADAIATHNEVIRRFSNSTDASLMEQVAIAYNNKGFSLGALGKHADAIVAYDEALRHFGDSTAPFLKEQIATALNNKGSALGMLGKHADSIAARHEVVRRFGDSTEPALQTQVAIAIVNKGITLVALNKPDEAIANYDEVIQRFSNSTDSTLKHWTAAALNNKGFAFSSNNKRAEAIIAFDETVRRFGNSNDSTLQNHVATALVVKGLNLTIVGKKSEAIAAYDEVIQRFGKSSDPTLKKQVDTARDNKQSLN